MIIKSLISFIAFLIIWSIYLFYHPEINVTNGNYQFNLSKAQNYLHNEKKSSVIIVGSSLSNRIKSKDNDRVTNLAFLGMSPINGLLLISRNKNTPDYILIETNNILGGRNSDFLSNLFHPINYFLKSNLPFLRANKQPLNFLSKDILPIFYEKLSAKILGEIDYKQEAKYQILIREKMLRHSIAKYKTSEIENSNKSVRELDSLINILSIKGSKIIFYEMPTHKKLYGLQKRIHTQKIIGNYIRKKHYQFIPLPIDSLEYATTDGVHLGPSEAKRYSKYFEQQLKILEVLK